MRAPLSWLQDFTPVDADVDTLVAALNDLGLIVEAVERVGEGLEQVVVARVLEVAAIPGADRIRRVVVDGGQAPIEIVCGAFNFGVDDLVPLAGVGTVLPNGMTIARRTMRGVTSSGMLCSGRELGLSEDAEGLLGAHRHRGGGGRCPARRGPWHHPGHGLRHHGGGPTAPTRGASPGWPGTWPPGSAFPSGSPRWWWSPGDRTGRDPGQRRRWRRRGCAPA